MKPEETIKHFNFYSDHYHVNYYKLETENITNDKKKFIGAKKHRKCRFCGKEKDETTFKKIAHAIPELVGNKVLISYEECDICNKIFSKLENELAHYLSFERSAMGIRGKTGVPIYKKKNGLRIEYDKKEKNKFLIQDFIDSGNIVEEADTNSLTIKGERNSYIPISVYKCFAKMALSIMPKHYIPYFYETFEWIKDDGIPINKNLKLMIFEQFIPGPKPFADIEMTLALRKWESSEKSPFCIFIISFGNFCYQIYLPFAGPDFNKSLEGSYKYMLFPSKYALLVPEDSIHVHCKDFSLSERRKGEKIDITYSYDEKLVVNDAE